MAILGLKEAKDMLEGMKAGDIIYVTPIITIECLMTWNQTDYESGRWAVNVKHIPVNYEFAGKIEAIKFLRQHWTGLNLTSNRTRKYTIEEAKKAVEDANHRDAFLAADNKSYIRKYIYPDLTEWYLILPSTGDGEYSTQINTDSAAYYLTVHVNRPPLTLETAIQSLKAHVSQMYQPEREMVEDLLSFFP